MNGLNHTLEKLARCARAALAGITLSVAAVAFLLLDGRGGETRGNEPAKPKAKYNAWAPQDKAIRALLWYDSRQGNFGSSD